MDHENFPQAAREQRRADRFDTDMPVHVAGSVGQAHNVSAQGIYFETEIRQEPGSLVDITLEYTLYGRRQRLLCEGKVVRVEPRGERLGVAARLLAPFFDEDRRAG